MREVLRATRDRDAEAALWLEIIDLFDGASAGRTPAQELARIAVRASGRPAGIRDEWNGIDLQVAGDDEGASLEVARVTVAHRVRGRSAVALPLATGSALAASIEVGAGRIGVAWLLGDDEGAWRPLDYLVVERLAAAAAVRALEERARRVTADPAAVERLLARTLTEYELAQASRRAGLSPSGRYVAIALDQVPPNAVSLETLGALVERTIGESGTQARSAVVGRTAVVVATAADGVDGALHNLSRSRDALGFAVHAGVGEPRELGELPASWEQAREALALRRMAGGDGSLAFFRDLRGLHLLAQIPKEEVLGSALFRRLTGSLSHQGRPSDIDVLEAYLEQGTLRRASQKVFLHHTSVQSRLKRIEHDMEIDLADADARFEVAVLLKLYRILQARDASNPL